MSDEGPMNSTLLLRQFFLRVVFLGEECYFAEQISPKENTNLSVPFTYDRHNMCMC